MDKLIRTLQGTAEIYGRQMSSVAAEVFLEDLRAFPEESLLLALSKCRKELRTFPTVADILARIEDGRPGVEEAWGMIPWDESQSAVLTEEVLAAFGACRGLYFDGDRVAARMTFKETYQKAVAENRSKGIPPKWTVSIGYDRHGRDAAIREAVLKRRLTVEHAERISPEFQLTASDRQALGFTPTNFLPEFPR